MNTRDRLTAITAILTDSNTRLKERGKALSEVDKKILDIEHVTEFYNFDAVTMVKLQKKLKELLVERRTIKNEFSELTAFMARFGTGDLHKNINAVNTTISNNENIGEKKSYAVRALTDIFGETLKSGTKPTFKL